MIRVWSDNKPAGVLDRNGQRGSAFVYEPGTAAERAVSVTMPVRLESWNTPLGVAPIFEMNLPEGALRERLRLAFAKATGTFDDVELLSIVGRSQLGRVRFTGVNDRLDEGVPFQSIDEIPLQPPRRRALPLPHRQVRQPLRHQRCAAEIPCGAMSRSVYRGPNPPSGYCHPAFVFGATHIVKFWDPAGVSPVGGQRVFLFEGRQGRCETCRCLFTNSPRMERPW